MNGLVLFSSALLGSSLATVFTGLLIKVLNLNFFWAGLLDKIPFLGQSLAIQKTYDLVDFGLTIFFSGVIYVVNLLIYKTGKKLNKGYFLYLIFSILIFLQTHFVTSSGRSVVILIVIAQILVLLISKKSVVEKIDMTASDQTLLLMNGGLAGWYTMILMNNLTTVITIPLMLLISGPMIYFLWGKRFTRFFQSYWHLLFAGSIIIPLNMPALLTLGVFTSMLSLLWEMRSDSKFIKSFVYPLIIIAVVLYNPLYYLGNFDSVEEGFWLGWLQRLIRHQVLYRDVAVYQPPFLSWGLYIFTTVTDYSIANARLFFHILQILGFSFYYFLVNRILDRKINKITVMILAISFAATQVRNNVEIRLGVGLLAILFYQSYLKYSKIKWAVLAGCFTTGSFFVSLEVGVATAIALSVGFLLERRSKTGFLGFAIGGIASSIPVFVFLAYQGALAGFIEQLTYYAKMFSEGYFNLPIERSINLSFLHWHIFNQYLGSSAWWWESAKLSLVVAILVAISTRERIILVMSIFTLILFRSALGRSDWYHLLFPLLTSLPLLFYIIEKLCKNRKSINVLVSVIFLFVLARDVVNANFAESTLFKFQTYSKVFGEYKRFENRRASILVNMETNVSAVDDLIEYIQLESTPDEKIFVYPWSPELYFLSDRINSTKFDTPYAFFTDKYQNEMIDQLQRNKTKFVIFNPEMKFAGMVPDSLPKVKQYLDNNFVKVSGFGRNQILVPKPL